MIRVRRRYTDVVMDPAGAAVHGIRARDRMKREIRRHGRPPVGILKVTRADGSVEYQEPYSDERAEEIIREGIDRANWTQPLRKYRERIKARSESAHPSR